MVVQAGGVGIIARFLGGDGEDYSLDSVVLACLGALRGACKDHERNRDAFIYTSMDQVSEVGEVG